MRTSLVSLVIFLAACPAQPPPKLPGSGDSPSVAGYFKGAWGELVLRQQGEKLRGVYGRDGGTVLGMLSGDTMIGWWCETPTRQPKDDAGDVELKFINNDDKLTIDGRWRDGAEGEWHDELDLEKSTDMPAPALEERFSDATSFCPKP